MINNLLDSRWHSEEWIKNVSTDYDELGKKFASSCYKKENSRISHKINVKKHKQTLKYKISRKRIMALRHSRIKNLYVPDDEKEMIKIFYAECPFGFVVDHIIPIAKGGDHRLSNMQWLSFKINAV